jgi:GNAT superfamily N-acetyltransferase
MVGENGRMKIRPITPDDLNDILRMAHNFHASSHVAESLPFCDQSFTKSIVDMLSDGYGMVYVAENDSGLCGMIGVMLNRHWFNNSLLLASDLFWWVDESARGSSAGLKLLNAAENWAKECGCYMVVMAHTPTIQPEKVHNLYIRRGYAQQDTYYAKVVNHA